MSALRFHQKGNGESEGQISRLWKRSKTTWKEVEGKRKGARLAAIIDIRNERTIRPAFTRKAPTSRVSSRTGENKIGKLSSEVLIGIE